jgi:uncharacterized metal-binding protein YceD (DUF177 family)
MTPEFSRPIDVRRPGDLRLTLTANEGERAALARRFGLLAIHRLEAEIELTHEAATIAAEGRLAAEIVQSCAVSAEPLAVRIDEPVALRFVPGSRARRDEEIELEAADCDELEYDGTTIDLGEALAQTLALAIDPYATGPEAEVVRARHGLDEEEASGPFAALAALKRPN